MLKDISANSSGERFVYIWGDHGSGKSHLLKAFVAAIRNRQLNAAYIAPNEADKSGLEHDRIDCYAIDDVDNLDNESQIKLFNLYNEIRNGQGLLIVSGKDIPTRLNLREDLVTRLSWGLVYALHGLTDEEKTEALMRHAHARGFNLAPEVTNYLMSHVRRDFPTLVATLDALDRFSLETKRSITLPLLREIIRMEETH